MDYLKKYLPSYQVNCLLYTHKHWDHAGGSEQLIQMIDDKHLKVVAGKEDGEAIKGSNLLIGEDTQIDVNKTKVRVYNVPCHTRGHLLYHFIAGNNEEDVPTFNETTYTSENK
jgi:hydroxyacylglutathione hydrolase